MVIQMYLLRNCFPVLALLLLSTSLFAQQRHQPNPEATCENRALPEADGAARIRAAFSTRGDFAYSGEPLSQVAESLGKRFNINVVLDRHAITFSGFEPNTPVTIDLKDVTLKSALRHILRQHELSWMIRYESLIITSPEEAEDNPAALVYDVTDFVDFCKPDFDTLRSTIIYHCSPSSWDEGNNVWSQVQPISYGNKHVLVISQTYEVHWEIEELLRALRNPLRPDKASDR